MSLEDLYELKQALKRGHYTLRTAGIKYQMSFGSMPEEHPEYSACNTHEERAEWLKNVLKFPVKII